MDNHFTRRGFNRALIAGLAGTALGSINPLQSAAASEPDLKHRWVAQRSPNQAGSSGTLAQVILFTTNTKNRSVRLNSMGLTLSAEVSGQGQDDEMEVFSTLGLRSLLSRAGPRIDPARSNMVMHPNRELQVASFTLMIESRFGRRPELLLTLNHRLAAGPTSRNPRATILGALDGLRHRTRLDLRG